MTKDELCIRAAKYAIGKMTLSGSYGFVTITQANEGLQQISWAEVVKWLDNIISRNSARYISIDNVMSVFDDYMRGDVNEDDRDTFFEMLKDKVESEE